MSLVNDAVNEMEKRLVGSGCDHGIVTLTKCTDRLICPFLDGSCMEALYGGKRVEIATSYPLDAKTRVSFMYGEKLLTPGQRSAACAILNCLSSFMCFPRISGACPEGCGQKCLDELRDETEDMKIYLNGSFPGLEVELRDRLIDDPGTADLIIVSGEGLFSQEGLDICERYKEEKKMLFIAPATSGFANMLGFRHWCPYGRKK